MAASQILGCNSQSELGPKAHRQEEMTHLLKNVACCRRRTWKLCSRTLRRSWTPKTHKSERKMCCGGSVATALQASPSGSTKKCSSWRPSAGASFQQRKCGEMFASKPTGCALMMVSCKGTVYRICAESRPQMPRGPCQADRQRDSGAGGPRRGQAFSQESAAGCSLQSHG